MSEFEVVQNSPKAFSEEMLIIDLKRLGLKNGDNILVHSSLSKLGWIICGQRTVLSALLNVIGKQGTIVMPAFSGDNSDPINWRNPAVPKDWIVTIKENMPPFDTQLTGTRLMGKVADLFKCYEGVKRSYHPQVSFCALGPLTDELLNNHQLSPGFGENSPLQRMYDKKFKVLLLGIGYENCTCMHLAEVWSENKQWVQTGSRITKNGENIWHEYNEIDYDDSDFSVIGEDYEKEHTVDIGMVGNGIAKLVDMQSVSDFAFKWMKENRKSENIGK